MDERLNLASAPTMHLALVEAFGEDEPDEDIAELDVRGDAA